jgi:hypothetical protein
MLSSPCAVLISGLFLRGSVAVFVRRRRKRRESREERGENVNGR